MVKNSLSLSLFIHVPSHFLAILCSPISIFPARALTTWKPCCGHVSGARTSPGETARAWAAGLRIVRILRLGSSWWFKDDGSYTSWGPFRCWTQLQFHQRLVDTKIEGGAHLVGTTKPDRTLVHSNSSMPFEWWFVFLFWNEDHWNYLDFIWFYVFYVRAISVVFL